MKDRDRLSLLVLAVAASTWLGCSRTRVESVNHGRATSDPCARKKAGDHCVPRLPSVAPVVAGEGRIWGLFARRSDFEIREYSAQSDSVLAQSSCPSNSVAAVLGAVDQQPAVICANYEHGTVVFGRKIPNRRDFVWQAAETLARDASESVRSISHFALLERRLAVVYRTEMHTLASGLPTTQWRLQIAGAPAQMTRPAQSSKPTAPAQSEVLCPRATVTRCEHPPVTAYVADGQMHVILASGVAADRYLHLQRAPGKPSKTIPVADVTLAGRSLKAPCVSKSTNGNLKVFVPARSLVSALMGDAGERVGVIEHGGATIAQGPDVYASEGEQCPPEVSALAPFSVGASGAPDAKPQWLRATQSRDTWIIGYGVPPFAVMQNGVMVSYSESFWVVRR